MYTYGLVIDDFTAELFILRYNAIFAFKLYLIFQFIRRNKY